MTRLTLSTPPDFSLEATVVSHGWYVLPPFRWDAGSGRLHRVEWFDGAGAFELTIRHDGRLMVESKRDLSPVRDELRARLRRMFQLELELGSFHSLCEKRKSHRPVAGAKFGRLLCGSTLFEDAVKIIATTNTAWGQTVRMVTQIVDACGGQTDSGSPRAFPTPAQLAALGDAALRERCRLGYRAPYVHALAEGVASGTLDLREIANRALTTEELFKSYRRLPGIGPYGAAHLLAMDGRHDYIAVDTEFRSFVRRRHFRGAEASNSDMLAVYERWGKWKYMGYWSELWLDLSRKVGKNEEKRQ